MRSSSPPKRTRTAGAGGPWLVLRVGSRGEGHSRKDNTGRRPRWRWWGPARPQQGCGRARGEQRIVAWFFGQGPELASQMSAAGSLAHKNQKKKKNTPNAALPARLAPARRGRGRGRYGLDQRPPAQPGGGGPAGRADGENGEGKERERALALRRCSTRGALSPQPSLPFLFFSSPQALDLTANRLAAIDPRILELKGRDEREREEKRRSPPK